MEIEQKKFSEIVWESEGKNEDGVPYFTVKKARGYYYYGERAGRDSVAFVLFDANKKKFALIKESKPPMDEVFKKRAMMITAFGGSMEKGKTPEEICIKEVKEESGYEVTEEDIFCVGTTLVSTQMNQGCVGFFVDVTGKVPGETEIERLKNDVDQNEKDPYEFSNNEVVWMTLEEVVKNNDWKSIWIISKVMFNNVKQFLELEILN